MLNFYNERASNLGKRFANQVIETVLSVRENPLQYPLVFETYRQAIVPKFPFVLIFEFVDDKVILLAIFHTSRHPENWQGRKL